MQVTLTTSVSRDGDGVVVRSSSGEWPAVWRGEFNVEARATIDVEIEIAEPISWASVVRAEGDTTGIRVVGPQVTICGVVKTVSDDDVISVDLQPGVVLVEMDGMGPTVEVGDLIRFSPRLIELFPTGI